MTHPSDPVTGGEVEAMALQLQFVMARIASNDDAAVVETAATMLASLSAELAEATRTVPCPQCEGSPKGPVDICLVCMNVGSMRWTSANVARNAMMGYASAIAEIDRLSAEVERLRAAKD